MRKCDPVWAPCPASPCASSARVVDQAGQKGACHRGASFALLPTGQAQLQGKGRGMLVLPGLILHLAHYQILWFFSGQMGQKGTPPWVWLVWTPGKEAARLASSLTCQCLVTAFHTPIRPVWLVAMSWFPTKNKASTGTPRWKTPAEGEKGSARTPSHSGRSGVEGRTPRARGFTWGRR